MVLGLWVNKTVVLENRGKVGNFDYGNFDIEKFNFENCKFEFEFNFELDLGVTADDVRGCYDPVLVVFLSKLKSVFVEINLLYQVIILFS